MRLFGFRRHLERGATVVEYGLLLALIFIAIVGAVTLFAGNAVELFDTLPL